MPLHRRDDQPDRVGLLGAQVVNIGVAFGHGGEQVGAAAENAVVGRHQHPRQRSPLVKQAGAAEHRQHDKP
jgi:hypothetical protein